MKCRKVIHYLNAYAYGELTGKRCRAVEAHLAGCDFCRERFEEIRGAVIALVRGLAIRAARLEPIDALRAE